MLCDSKLDAPLSSCTCSGLHNASYASYCYTFAICSLCNESDLITYNKAQSIDSWVASMQSEYDAIIKNGAWYLCDLHDGKKAINTKWV